MYSEIIQRTPSIYFKFDDQSHRNNFSKSSLALDYSISNQKHILSNQRFNKQRTNTNTTNKHQLTSKQDTHSPVKDRLSPMENQFTNTIQKSTTKPKFQEEEDQFMKLHRCHNKPSPTHQKQTKLKTEDFFEEFDKKYSFTFEDDIRTHEFILEAEYEGGSKISRGYLDFEEFQVQQTMKLIQIDSKKDLTKTNSINSTSEINSTNEINQINNESNSISQSNLSNVKSFVKTNDKIFSSHVTISDNEHEQTQNKKKNPELSNQRSQEFSTDKQNHMKNQDTEFDEVISFGPNKAKKYNPSNSRHFITKDFNNNSSLIEKSKPIIEPKRRVPFKHIENLIQKNKDQNHSLTRKKPIINTDLLISTINRTQKHHVKQTHGVWSNPINNKKSSSLECTFTYDNMFKTNSFRETLKSTTLQNWRKKYHKKIEDLGEKKTVLKKYRDSNIFDNLFIRA